VTGSSYSKSFQASAMREWRKPAIPQYGSKIKKKKKLQFLVGMTKVLTYAL
jgi:hypothetical protein